MKRTIIALLAVFAALSFSSCVHDEAPIFEESASVRLQNALKNAQTVLVGAENGWRMYYYPDPDQSYGGYLYTMKFSQEEVEVWSDLFEGSSKSLYKMATDDGPVLSFDTGNEVFHFFATPAGSYPNLYGLTDKYQAFKGDFEFLIISATPDEVVLKGKRTGNKIVMYPLAASDSPAQIASETAKRAEEVFVSSFDGTIGGEEAYVYLYLSDRWASIELTGEKYAEDETAYAEVPYSFTETGIRFYEPVTVGAYTIQYLDWVADTQMLVSRSGDETAVSLKGKLPEGWHAYEDFIGTWTLAYRDGARTMSDITIAQNVKGSSYTISGLSNQFDVVATYDLSAGQIEIQAQYVGDNGTYLIMMAAWDSNAGYVNYAVGGQCGMLNDTADTITWHDNGKWSGYKVESFILYYFTSAGSRVGAAQAPWLWKGLTTNQLWGWTTFTRQ